MLSLPDNNQTDIIEAINSTSTYLDDLLSVDNPYFEQMVGQIYPTGLQLNKANSSDTGAPFFGLELVYSKYIFLGLSVLLECVQMLMHSTKENYF